MIFLLIQTDDEKSENEHKFIASKFIAAAAICMENTVMPVQRKELLEQAKERVHNEGFIYKKGKSRFVSKYCIALYMYACMCMYVCVCVYVHEMHGRMHPN